MKINKTLTALVAGASLGLSSQAMAAGTASNVTITNTVTLDFSVGLVPQTQLVKPVSFLVDNKVDLDLTWQDIATLPTGIPGQTQVAFKYLLTNEGNTEQDYLLSAGELANGTAISPYSDTDDDDTDGNYSFYLSDGDATFEPGTDDIVMAGNKIEDILADGTQEFWAVAGVPSDAVDLTQIGLEVRAMTADKTTGLALSESTAVDKNLPANINTNVLIAFAEGTGDSALTLGNGGVRDGAFVDIAGLDVVTANLVMTKAVIVKSDPVGSANPKAIPGAIVTYTITVENQGRAAATGINIVDNVGAIATLDTSDSSATDLDALADLIIEINSTVVVPDSNAMAQGIIDVTFNSLPATDSTNGSGLDFLTIEFDATIK